VQHALDAWAWWAAGIWGCWVLARGERSRAILGLWLVWVALFAVETYTSGIAYMLNHMGPGSFLAGVWLAAALPSIWPSPRSGGRPLDWLRAALLAAVVVLFFSGLNAIRVPVPSLSADGDRYAGAIEREFEGEPPGAVLLDHGSWLYLRTGTVQYDRSAVAGEAGFTQTADFSGMLERLRSRAYSRVLVRNLDSDEFMYDHGVWEKSSGMRDSLLAHYQVVRKIPGVAGTNNVWLRPISVLEPRAR
jgi:hypothetical protein